MKNKKTVKELHVTKTPYPGDLKKFIYKVTKKHAFKAFDIMGKRHKIHPNKFKDYYNKNFTITVTLSDQEDFNDWFWEKYLKPVFIQEGFDITE